MQPFLQDSNSATTLRCSSGAPEFYMEVLPDDQANTPKDSHIGEYEIPRSIPGPIIAENRTLNTELNSTSTLLGKRKNVTDGAQLQSEPTVDNQEYDRNSLHKRSSITSLNLTDRKRASLTSVRKKSKTLDNVGGNTPIVQSSASKDASPLSINQRRDFQKSSTGASSETSLEDRSCSSFESSVSLAPSTRPSSSLINSQQSHPSKNGSVLLTSREIVPCEASTAKPQKLLITHATLQNGKANIPLVINTQRALSNLLGQSRDVEDSSTIVTYTNLNSKAARVN